MSEATAGSSERTGEVVISSDQPRMQFKSPPIVEAIIAVTIEELPDSIVETFRHITPEMIELGFAKRAPVMSYEFRVDVEGGEAAASKSENQVGVRYFSDGSPYSVQFLRTGFTFSRAGVYDGWERFTEVGKRVLAVYLRVVGDARAASVSIRYINKIYIPQHDAAEKHLRVYVQIPPELPQAIGQQFFSVLIPFGEREVFTHQQTLIPPDREGYNSLLLDNQFTVPLHAMNETEIWSELARLREIKNDYFLKMLTPLALEGFDA